MKSIASSDHAINPGGAGGLLYPKTPTELFPGSAAFDNTDTDTDDPSDPPRPLRHGPSPPLTLAQTLLQKGASPNTPLNRFEVPAWPGGSRWTPWTATLLCLAGVIRKGELLDETLLAVIELYLTHGADPTVCFVGRYVPKHKLKPVPVWRVGPGIYASLKLEAHIPKLFGDGGKGKGKGKEGDGGRWWYLTLAQLVEMVGDCEGKKRVAELVYAKSPWKVAKWVGMAAQSLALGGGGKKEEGSKIEKLELGELGGCYFFVGMIVREQELGRLVVPEEAKTRLLPASLIPV